MDRMKKDVLQEIIANYWSILCIKEEQCNNASEKEKLTQKRRLVNKEKTLLYRIKDEALLESLYNKIEDYYSLEVKQWIEKK